MCDSCGSHAHASACWINPALKQKKKKFGAGRRKAKANRSRPDAAPVFVSGRHPDVAVSGAHEEVARFCSEFRQLSRQTLLAMSIGACQQLVEGLGSLSFPFSSERDVLPADRAGHVAELRVVHAVHLEHLARLTNAVNHLVAIEHAVAAHLSASSDDIEAHDAHPGQVCDGCGFTAAAFAAAHSH